MGDGVGVGPGVMELRQLPRLGTSAPATASLHGELLRTLQVTLGDFMERRGLSIGDRQA